MFVGVMRRTEKILKNDTLPNEVSVIGSRDIQV